MKIDIKVTTKAKRSEVKKLPDGNYKVFVSVAPEKGKANEAVVELLAEYFEVKKRDIVIQKGAKSEFKIVNIKKAT